MDCSYHLTQQIRTRHRPGLLKSLGKFCFLKLTVISYTKQENIYNLSVSHLQRILWLTLTPQGGRCQALYSPGSS